MAQATAGAPLGNTVNKRQQNTERSVPAPTGAGGAGEAAGTAGAVPTAHGAAMEGLTGLPEAPPPGGLSMDRQGSSSPALSSKLKTPSCM